MRLKEITKILENILRFKHSPIPGFPTRLVTLSHAKDPGPILSQLTHISLRRWVRPHLSVHGWRQDEGGALHRTRQAQEAQQIICPSMNQLGHEIRAGRRNQNGISSSGQIDVRHVVELAIIPLGDEHLSARKRLHGHRGNELGGSLRHHHLNAGTGLDEQAAQFGGLITGNPTT